MENKHVVGFVLILVILGGAIVALTSRNTEVGPDLTAFAQCVKQSGAAFYGAYWCPHCQNTKKLFGTAQKELPYVECSTADGKGQTQICIDKGIKSYPTWEFADGTRASGELTLQDISFRTGCVLPDAGGKIETPVNTGTSSEAISPAV